MKRAFVAVVIAIIVIVLIGVLIVLANQPYPPFCVPQDGTWAGGYWDEDNEMLVITSSARSIDSLFLWPGFYQMDLDLGGEIGDIEYIECGIQDTISGRFHTTRLGPGQLNGEFFTDSPGYYRLVVGFVADNDDTTLSLKGACITNITLAEPTSTPFSTNTPYPTYTPYPTHTPYPTYYPFISPLWPYPTWTPTPSPTPIQPKVTIIHIGH